ncbi:MAG: hypothetical protein QXQ79_00360 [Candidatus Nanoarchaeia archaeon]
MNKKALAPQTLGELILIIAGGIIILFIFLAIAGYISPTLGSFSCGLNVRIFGATQHATEGILTAPIVLCNQYNDVVKINAADFSKCPGIAKICKASNLPDEVLVECYKQCARIQVDALTDSCWSMGGSGRVHLWTFAERFSAAPWEDIAAAATAITTTVLGIAITPISGPAGVIVAVGSSSVLIAILEKNIKPLSFRAAVLKCYKFQIIHPINDPKGKPINYFDGSFGRSWVYGMVTVNTSDNTQSLATKYSSEFAKCASSKNPFCSFGGHGVKYVMEADGIKNAFEISGESINTPNININDNNFDALIDLGFTTTAFLNYNVTEPRQICYIAYYNDGGQADVKFVMRSCKGWVPERFTPYFKN